jgi:hypothetical protein
MRGFASASALLREAHLSWKWNRDFHEFLAEKGFVKKGKLYPAARVRAVLPDFVARCRGKALKPGAVGKPHAVPRRHVRIANGLGLDQVNKQLDWIAQAEREEAAPAPTAPDRLARIEAKLDRLLALWG